MEYFVISAKFVPLKYYTLSSQLRRLTSFSVGLFGSANSVTRSYSVMRKLCIKYDFKNIICGVPQGLILGPLLFILYINDITNTSTLLDFILFADDTTILFSSDDICSETNKINKELSEIGLEQINYLLMLQRLIIMIMGTPKLTMMNNTGGNESENFDIILDDVKQARVNNTKFLGVIIDENLTLKNHIDGITKNNIKKYWYDEQT